MSPRTVEESRTLVPCRVHGVPRCAECAAVEDALLRDYALDVPIEEVSGTEYTRMGRVDFHPVEITEDQAQALGFPPPPPYDSPLPIGHPLLVWRKCEFCREGRVHPEARGWRCDRCYGFWHGGVPS